MPVPVYVAASESREHPQRLRCEKRCEVVPPDRERIIAAAWLESEERGGFEIGTDLSDNRLRIDRGEAKGLIIMIRTEKARYWVRIDP